MKLVSGAKKVGDCCSIWKRILFWRDYAINHYRETGANSAFYVLLEVSGTMTLSKRMIWSESYFRKISTAMCDEWTQGSEVIQEEKAGHLSGKTTWGVSKPKTAVRGKEALDLRNIKGLKAELSNYNQICRMRQNVGIKDNSRAFCFEWWRIMVPLAEAHKTGESGLGGETMGVLAIWMQSVCGLLEHPNNCQAIAGYK